MASLDFPRAYELFERPRPPRLPHPDMPKGEPSPAMEIADRECARLIVNYCFFDPPIADRHIECHAANYAITFQEAELELRRLRK